MKIQWISFLWTSGDIKVKGFPASCGALYDSLKLLSLLHTFPQFFNSSEPFHLNSNSYFSFSINILWKFLYSLSIISYWSLFCLISFLIWFPYDFIRLTFISVINKWPLIHQDKLALVAQICRLAFSATLKMLSDWGFLIKYIILKRIFPLCLQYIQTFCFIFKI